jgi:HEAT repeat protein
MDNFGVASLAIVFMLTSPIHSSDATPDQKQSGNQKNERALTAGKSVTELIEALKHGEAEVRADACQALAALSPKARPALRALIDTLADRDRFVRWSAAYAIGAMGPDAVQAVPKLIKALGDRDETVRLWTAYSIGKIGPNARSAVPSLIRLLKDKESDVRAYAAIALGDIGRQPAVVVPALAAALQSEVMPCRYFGSMAFYTNRDVKRVIAESLARFGQKAVPVLTGLLKHPSKEVRWCALYSLGEIGSRAKAAADGICKALQDKDEHVCALAVRTLVIVDPARARIVPLLMESLRSKSDSVRYAAAESLGDLGPRARAAVPLLIRVYKANDIMIGGSHCVVGEALERIDPEAARRLGIK